MKKIMLGLISTVIVVCMSVTVFAASTSTVSIKNNDSKSKPVTYTYSPDKNGEIGTSITSLMTKLDDLSKQSSVVQTLTLTSESANNIPVSFKLRLSLPEKATSTMKPEVVKTPSPDEYSALDYYNLKITDASDNVIYTYENDKNNDEKRTYKDIPLGVLNTTLGAENKIYNITVSINKSVKTSAVEKYVDTLEWSLISSTDFEEPTTAPTVVPTTEVVATAMATPAQTPVQTPTQTASASVKEDKNGTITLSAGEYLCGRDIDSGRYTISGNGKVNVYTSEGVLKSTVVLKNKNNSSANGVEEYIINLLDGEKINVESDTKFVPYTASKATSAPKATNKATTKPTAKSTAKATSTPAASNSKNNPKTGDTAPIVGMITLGVIAIGGFVYLEIKKRKHN